MAMSNAFSRFRDSQPKLSGPSDMSASSSPFARFRQKMGQRQPPPGGPSVIGNLLGQAAGPGSPTGGAPFDFSQLAGGPQVASEGPGMFPPSLPPQVASENPNMVPSPFAGITGGAGGAGGGLASILARLKQNSGAPPAMPPMPMTPPSGPSSY